MLNCYTKLLKVNGQVLLHLPVLWLKIQSKIDSAECIDSGGMSDFPKSG